MRKISLTDVSNLGGDKRTYAFWFINS